MAGNTVRFKATLDDRVTGPLGKISDKFSTLGKSGGFKALAQGVGMGAGMAAFNLLGDAAGAAADFIGESIDASRDLTETLSKSSVIFGTSAKNVEEWGDKAAKSLGLSKQAAIEAAATFGNFFVGLGQSETQAAGLSEKVVDLAGDLASFNNMDPNEVLDKLRAGLAGEAEPLRRMGVFLTEAKVKAKAMEMGLADANGEVSEGAKVMARYKIIMDETGTAQGDFARTSDDLANSQRTANAELIDAQAQLGTSFEPIALGVTKAQIGIVEWFRKGVEGWQMLADKASGSSSAIKDDTEQMAHQARMRLIGSGGLAPALDFVGDKSWELAGDIKKSTEKAVGYFDTMRQGILDDTTALIDGAFDPLEAKLEAEGRHFTLLADIQARESAKGKEAINSANSSIVSDLDDQATTLKGLGEKHKLTKKQVETFAADAKAAFASMGRKVPKDIQKVIDKLNTLAGFDGSHIKIGIDISQHVGIGGKVAGKKRAAGGSVMAGEAYTIGEKGPETLVMGSSSGYVIPNGKGGGGNVSIVYSPQFSTASAAEAQRFMRAIVPELQRELRKQGFA